VSLGEVEHGFGLSDAFGDREVGVSGGVEHQLVVDACVRQPMRRSHAWPFAIFCSEYEQKIANRALVG
jgi:hypothetical protein